MYWNKVILGSRRRCLVYNLVHSVKPGHDPIVALFFPVLLWSYFRLLLFCICESACFVVRSSFIQYVSINTSDTLRIFLLYAVRFIPFPCSRVLVYDMCGLGSLDNIFCMQQVCTCSGDIMVCSWRYGFTMI